MVASSLEISPNSKKLAVAGATGRLGSLVVKELLTQENSTVIVRALVRDVKTAESKLPLSSNRLEIVCCDLSSESDIETTCNDVDGLIW